MSLKDPIIRNISDTALWIAAYRAYESERPDAHFVDPFARKLAGERGLQIIQSDKFLPKIAWPFIARTYLLDEIVLNHVREGGDMVINLAAGLDTRPYRLDLPTDLQWIEVDLPGILDYKERKLKGEKPVCKLEHVRQDLFEIENRNILFENLGTRCNNALVITEGLLVYLEPEVVSRLAEDLANIKSIRKWATDLTAPAVVELMKKRMKIDMVKAGIPFKFAPNEGVHFFEPLGWKAIKVGSQMKTARKLKRLPLSLWFWSMLPDPEPPFGRKPWSGVCLFEKTN